MAIFSHYLIYYVSIDFWKVPFVVEELGSSFRQTASYSHQNSLLKRKNLQHFPMAYLTKDHKLNCFNNY
jgi:hypothetical protein